MLQLTMQGNIAEAIARQRAAAAAAITAAVVQATEGLKEELRADVARAGLGQRLAHTWRSQVYPARGGSLGPAGLVWSKAPLIIRAFSEGVPIVARNRRFLAIPTSAAPPGCRSPAEAGQRMGVRLAFVPRGDHALLVARQRRRSVVVYILAWQVNPGKRLDFLTVAPQWAARLPGFVKIEM